MSDFPNSGLLFRVHDKKSERSPDMQGECEIAGVEYKIAGWTKEGKKGKFLTLKFTPKTDYEAEDRKRRAAAEIDDSHIPF